MWRSGGVIHMKIIVAKSKDRTPPEILVDDADYEWLAQFIWTYAGYARTRIKQADGSFKSAQMHRMIMDAPDGTYVDHINRKRYDNRRSNLRVVTPTQNNWNKVKQSDAHGTSEFIGVLRRSESSGWTAMIQGQLLGIYDTEIEAAHVRDQAAMQLYGEFAYLNFNYEPQ